MLPAMTTAGPLTAAQTALADAARAALAEVEAAETGGDLDGAYRLAETLVAMLGELEKGAADARALVAFLQWQKLRKELAGSPGRTPSVLGALGERWGLSKQRVGVLTTTGGQLHGQRNPQQHQPPEPGKD